MSILTSFLVAVVTVYLAWGFALRTGWLDRPNERSFHKRPVPRIGGVGIMLGALAGIYLGAGAVGTALYAIAFGVGAISLLDDRMGLPRWMRFMVHGAAAVGLMLSYGHWQDGALPLLGALPVWLLALLVFVWVAGLINAYNFMDGIDGIAGWQGSVAAFGWAVVLLGQGETALASGCAAVGAACLGFLVWNRPVARIFMGDVGSTFLGTLFAGMPLLAMQAGVEATMAWETGFLLLWPFIIDAAQTLTLRALRRERIFDAHRSHIYQRLAATWTSRARGHWYVGLLYAGLAVLGMLLALQEGALWAKLGVLVGIWAAVVGWTYLREMDAQPEGDA